MTKHKRATASKHAHRPKIAAKAQKAAQAIVRSPTRSAGAGPTKSPPKRHNESREEPLLVENLATLLEEDRGKQTMTDKTLSKGTYFSAATATVSAYQAKLLEMAQANTQLAFEFAQRLATIRSPLEFPIVIAEFTSKRVTMFRKHSTELAELSIKR
jgi:hypothetical protein